MPSANRSLTSHRSYLILFFLLMAAIGFLVIEKHPPSEPDNTGEEPGIVNATIPEAKAIDLAPSESIASPHFIKRELIEVSLSALQKNGANLDLPMPSKHRIECESSEVVAQVEAWADEAGFEISEPMPFHRHGGLEHLAVDLIKTEIPDVEDIHTQGRTVLEGMSDIPGTTYATWMGTIVR